MTTTIAHSLLDEPVFGFEDDTGARGKVTLPGLLARLSRGEPTSLTGLQAHQQHPMHAFCAQLGALCLVRATESEIAHDEARWKEMLLGAAAVDRAGAEAFTLVVGDLSKPAFLQPPVPEGKLDGLKSVHGSPSEELDVLITAKNHDVKVGRLGEPSIEQWVFGLVTLQTTQGFLGAGNYGIARMNGGFASRPGVALAPEHGAAARFRRDVEALLDARDELEEGFGFGKKGSLGLVWCAPWDGTTSLSFDRLDAFFIEVCRRIRLVADASGRVVAHRGSSKAARIEAKEALGNTGDAWTPVAQEGKALTLPEEGFTYERVQALLLGADYTPGAAGKAQPGDALWVGQVLVRGQGKTGGYHERWVSVPEKARRSLFAPAARAELAERARGWVTLAAAAELKVLKPALLALIQGAPDKVAFDDDRARALLSRFDAAVDAAFFPLLFEHVDEPPEQADRAFHRTLFELGRKILSDARESLPVPSARRWRAEDTSERVFFGAARKQLPLAFDQEREAASAARLEGGSP